MTLISRRPTALSLAILAGLLALSAAVGAVILTQSGKADEVELTTARLVPADAAVYVALNTDLSSSQWAAAFKLITRLGIGDPEQELKSSADLLDLNWQREVAPFLGGDAAIFLKSFNIRSFEVEGALIIKSNDPAKARQVVLATSAGPFRDGTRGSTRYSYDGNVWVALLGNHLVVASSEASLAEVIDVRDGKVPSLGAAPEFRRLHEQLTKNLLLFVYFNGQSLADELLNDAEVQMAIRHAGAGDIALKPGAFALSAAGDTFSWQAASAGNPGLFAPLMAPRTSHLVDIAPADSAIFVSTTHIRQTWEELLRTAGPDLDKAVAADGQFRSLDDALRQIGRGIGLNNATEIIALFGGETAFSAWLPARRSDPEVLLMADIADETEATRVLDAVFAAAAGRSGLVRLGLGGATVVTMSTGDGNLSYALQRGHLLLGTETAVKAAVEGRLGSLASTDRFKRTMIEVPGGDLGTFAYLDVQALLRLSGEEYISADGLDKLGGTLFNLIAKGGVARLSGTQLIEK